MRQGGGVGHAGAQDEHGQERGGGERRHGQGQGHPGPKGHQVGGNSKGDHRRGAWEAVAWSDSTTAGPLKHHRSSWSSIGP